MKQKKLNNIPTVKEDFIAIYGSIYYDANHGHWVTTECFQQKGFTTVEQLSSLMKQIVQKGTHEQKLSLLQSYPTLSYKTRDLEALSENSKNEQISVGLNYCSPEEGKELANLNKQYREKFNFPFIIAVRGAKNRHKILAELKRRVENDFETEFNTALDQIHIIAEFRLNDIAIKVPKQKLG